MKKVKLQLLGMLTLMATLALPVWALPLPANGLVAYYPFHGNAKDASGHNYNGSAVGGVTVVSNHLNQAASAYHLDGTNAYIYFGPILPDMTAMSFGAWVNAESSSGTTICEGDWQPGNDVDFTVTTTNELFYCTKDGYSVGTWQNFGANIKSNWTFVVWVVNTNLTQFYLDGTLATNLPQGGADLGYHDLIVGTQEFPKNGFGWQGYWKGAISDLMIYNRALSANEVSMVYIAESAPILSIQKPFYLTTASLSTGSNYQVQVTSDLVNWTNQGSAFTATNNYWSSTNYLNGVNGNPLFFRIQCAP